MHPSYLRQFHASQIFHALRAQPGISQKELSDLTGCDKSTVSIVIKRFEEIGLVERVTGLPDGRRGRPSEMIRISELSGLLMGMTVDIYSLYYAPVGILLGFVTGLVYRKFQPKKWQIFPAALVITLPSTIISSCITAFLFGGITSSGSTVLVQLLAKTPLGMVGSCFVVQFITDYIDRVLCIAVAAVLITALRKSMKENFA